MLAPRGRAEDACWCATGFTMGSIGTVNVTCIDGRLVDEGNKAMRSDVGERNGGEINEWWTAEYTVASKRVAVLCHVRSFIGHPRLLSGTRISDQAPQWRD